MKLSLRKARKSMGVDGVATVVSLVLLLLLVEWLRLAPSAANNWSLASGSLIQFGGNRYWVFGGKGSATLQLPLFLVGEVLAFLLNIYSFGFLVELGTPYLLARITVTTLVFWGFSYPLWNRIFSGKSP